MSYYTGDTGDTGDTGGSTSNTSNTSSYRGEITPTTATDEKYQYIFTLDRDLSVNDLLADYDSLRRYVCSGGQEKKQPTNICEIYDISSIKFNKNPFNKNAIDLNNNSIININKLNFKSQFCNYFKITPNRNLQFINLKLKTKNNANLSFAVFEYNTLNNVYNEIIDICDSLSHTIEPSSNIVFKFPTFQSLPYSIELEYFDTDNIFVIDTSYNIKWRIYDFTKTNTENWNNTSDIRFGNYSIKGMNYALKQMMLSNNVPLFNDDNNTYALDITADLKYPNFSLRLANNFYTLIEIDQTSTLFNLFKLKDTSHDILIEDNSSVIIYTECDMFKNTPVNLDYSYDTSITGTYYNFDNLYDLDINNPIKNVSGELIDNSLSGTQTFTLFKEHSYFDIMFDNSSVNFIKDTISGSFMESYDSSYQNIYISKYDISEVVFGTGTMNDISCINIISNKIDSINITNNDVSINVMLTTNYLDISSIYVQQNIDVSNSINIEKKTNLHNTHINVANNLYKLVRFDISGDVSFSNLRFISYNNLELSFNVYEISNNNYTILSNNINSLTYSSSSDISSLVFELYEAQKVGFYFKYDIVDYGNIFELNEDNNKIYYQSNHTDYKYNDLFLYFIQASIPLISGETTYYNLADINNFLKEGTGNTKHISYFDGSANATNVDLLDTSGVYSNSGVEYRLKLWPISTTIARDIGHQVSDEINVSFVDNIPNDIKFNILSEALFASTGYNPINNFNLFEDTNDNKLLFVLESSSDTSHSLLNNFQYTEIGATESFNDSFIRYFFRTTAPSLFDPRALDASFITLNNIENSYELNSLISNIDYIGHGFNTIEFNSNRISPLYLLDKTDGSNIVKNGDRTGIILTVKDEFLTNFDDYISIYAIDNNTDIDVSDVSKGSIKWKFNQTLKYKNKYFKHEQYTDYFTTENLADVNFKPKQHFFLYDTNVIEIDDSSFVTSTINSYLYDPSLTNTTSIIKTIYGENLYCDKLSLPINNLTDDERNQYISINNLYVNNNLNINNLNLDISSGLSISNYFYDEYEYLSNSEYDLSNSVFKLAYNSDVSYNMHILSVVGDTNTDTSGSDAGWEIGLRFNNDTNLNRISNKQNIRLVPSAIYKTASDVSNNWRNDADISDGLSSFQIDSDLVLYNSNFVLADERYMSKERSPQDISDALEKVCQLNPKIYTKKNYTTQEHDQIDFSDNNINKISKLYTDSGFTVQDISNDCSDLSHVIIGNNNAPMYVDNTQIDIYLCKAIQELYKRLLAISDKVNTDPVS